MADTGPAANYEAIAAALARTGATVLLGEKFLLQHDAPNRIVWCWTGADLLPAARVGGNPRSRFDDHWSAEVHCWGETFDLAYRLRQAVLRAVRDVMEGPNFRVGRTDVVSDKEHEHFGHLLVVRVTIISPLRDAALESPIVDDTKRTARASIARVAPPRVVSSGTEPPAIVVTGAQAGAHVVRLAIDRPGPRGVATFRFSMDDLRTWEAVNVLTGAACELGGTGFTVHFAEGLYALDNVYTFADSHPRAGAGMLEAPEDPADA